MLSGVVAFSIGILLVLGKESFKKNASEGLKSLDKIMLLIAELTLSTIALVLVAKKSKWTDVVQGIVMISAVMAFTLGIIKVLGSKQFKSGKNDGLQGIKDILLLIGGLTVSAMALVLVAKKSKWTDVVQGIMLLSSVMAFAIGILLVLGKGSFKKNVSEGLKSLEKIVLLIGGLTLLSIGLVLVAKKAKWSDVVQGIMLLSSVMAFAFGIIKLLGSKWIKGEKNEGLQGIKDILLLIGGLTISLTIVTYVAEKTKWTDVVQGIMMLSTITAFALGIIKILGSKQFKSGKNDGLQGIKDVLLLIGGLTLSLTVLVLVAEKTKWTDVIQGIVMLGAVVAFAKGILLVLGKNSFKKDASEGLQSIGKIMLLIGGLILSLTVLVLVAKKTKWTDMVQGIVMLGAVVAFALGLIWVLSRESFQKNAVKGLIGVGSIILLIAGVSAAMLIFAEYVKKIDGVKKESAWRAFGLMWAVIGGMAALAAVIGAIWSTGIGAGVFAAAFVGVEMIAAMIASVSSAILLFVELIEKTKALTKADINTAYDRIIGKGPNDTESLVGCLVSIVNAIDENIRWKAAPKIAAIGLALRPVISAISQFVDVVQKMASMQIADQWDKNGNPIHYLKLTPSKFKDAAKNLTDAFSTFLKDLSDGLKGFDATSLAIIQLLFPRQSGISKFFTGEKPGIGLVIKTLSDFIYVIQKMASMSVPDKWDKYGKPISYKKLDPEKDFKSAAVNLSSAFSTFISELGKGLEDVSIKSAIVLKLLGGDISGVLQGIGAAFNPIIQIAAGKMQVGNQTVDITLPKLKHAAKDVVKVISMLITDLSAIKDKIDFDDFEGAFACVDRIIELIGKIATSEAAKEDFPKKIKEMLIPGICGIFKFLQSTAYIDKADSNANSFEDAMIDFVDGIKELNRIQMNLFNKEFIDYSTNLVNGLNEIFNFLQSTKYLANAKSNSVVFKDIMKNTSAGINHIKPFLHATPKQIIDLANAMKQLDAELITKEEQRTKAIQSVASNFKDMAEGVNQLNKAMAESMRLTRLYDQMKSVTSGNIIAKGVSAAVEGAGAVASKVKEALNDNKSEEQQKVKEETKQKDREELAAVIGNAVSAALTAWSESHRDLTVQFSDNPEKIFGEVYHN